MTKKEIWKDVPNYEGYYQASDLGRVRSLDRTIFDKNGHKRFYKGRMFIASVDKDGYGKVSLGKNGKSISFKVSQIVAMAFLSHKPNKHESNVDHINGDKSDDSVDNLRIVTHRANSSICFHPNKKNFSSKYVGVYWQSKRNKWCSNIRYKGDIMHLGGFNDEIEASNAYQDALSKIEDGTFNSSDYKPKYSSRYKGIHFHIQSGRWTAKTRYNGKQVYIGCFKTELEAYEARKEFNNRLKK